MPQAGGSLVRRGDLMRRAALVAVIGLIAGLVVVGFGLGVARGAWPLGVSGEWTWARLPDRVPVLAWDIGRAVAVVGLYAAFAGAGWNAMTRPIGPRRRAAWLTGLAAAAVVMQAAVIACAPSGYGLARWVTLEMPGASGYLDVARTEMEDPGAFLRAYPEWIKGGDVLHVGTHPPGLFLVSRGVLGLLEGRPGLAERIAASLPRDLRRGMSSLLGGSTPESLAAVALLGSATLLACALTTVPLYHLARAMGAAPATAWTASTFWPVAPAALLFQPTADAAYPLLATTALGLAGRGGRARDLLAGVALAVGMMFTLAFLAVGLIAALIVATDRTDPAGGRLRSIARRLLAIGAGFVGATLVWWMVTRADPLAIWWANQANHARFYIEYPRDYWAWIVVNPIELAVAIGLPTALWGLVGLRWSGASRVAAMTLGVLLVLTLSGRSLSEVGRLWLPFMPALTTAAAVGLDRLEARGWARGWTVGLVGAQAVWLQAMIQVVYPV